MSRRRCEDSVGRTALLAALATSSRAELARRLRCSPEAIGYWASGQRTPDSTSRIALEADLGIDPSAWDVSNQTRVGASGATGSINPMRRSVNVRLSTAVVARIERLQAASAVAGAAPSLAKVVEKLSERGLAALEAELASSPNPEDRWR